MSPTPDLPQSPGKGLCSSRCQLEGRLLGCHLA